MIGMEICIKRIEVKDSMSLSIFGFRALWSPYFFIAVLLVTVGYFLLTIKY